VIRISITAAAFEAIATSLPSSVGYERAPDGEYHVWLEPRFVDRLRAMRAPGESYSDVDPATGEGRKPQADKNKEHNMESASHPSSR
jgi:hypothetical protein